MSADLLPIARGAGAGPIPHASGIGLRFPHHDHVLRQKPSVAWFEVHPENYMHNAGALEDLTAIRRDYPLSLHAVGLSLGSAEGVNPANLEGLAGLVDRLEPGLVSDHLSWSAAGGIQLPDLFPLPYTEEALAVTARNIDVVQERLQRQILIENPSAYLSFTTSVLREEAFLQELVRRCGCGVLLDVNNIYVSSKNRGRQPEADLRAFLATLPPEAIPEIHVAGHATQSLSNGATLLIDDHGSAVSETVWTMLATTLAALGRRPVLIEWDNDIPGFGRLQEEAALAERLLARAAPAERAHVAR